MKMAFSQNGRRNIAVVVDLLFLNRSRCAIAARFDAVGAAAGRTDEAGRRIFSLLNAHADGFAGL